MFQPTNKCDSCRFTWVPILGERSLYCPRCQEQRITIAPVNRVHSAVALALIAVGLLFISIPFLSSSGQNPINSKQKTGQKIKARDFEGTLKARKKTAGKNTRVGDSANIPKHSRKIDKATGKEPKRTDITKNGSDKGEALPIIFVESKVAVPDGQAIVVTGYIRSRSEERITGIEVWIILEEGGVEKRFKANGPNELGAGMKTHFSYRYETQRPDKVTGYRVEVQLPD